MADAPRLKFMCAHDGIEAHAVQIVVFLVVSELLQLPREGTRHFHGNAVFERMGHDNKMLHIGTLAGLSDALPSQINVPLASVQRAQPLHGVAEQS